MTLPLVAIVGLALAFDYINGFHDAANSIATGIFHQPAGAVKHVCALPPSSPSQWGL